MAGCQTERRLRGAVTTSQRDLTERARKAIRYERPALVAQVAEAKERLAEDRRRLAEHHCEVCP